MRWASSRPASSGVSRGQQVGLDAARALDLRGHLELRVAQLVLQRTDASSSSRNESARLEA